MDKRATARSITASYKIEQVENGWTVSTSDGTVSVFADAKQMAEWFCMVVGVPIEGKRTELDVIEEEIRKIARA